MCIFFYLISFPEYCYVHHLQIYYLFSILVKIQLLILIQMCIIKIDFGQYQHKKIITKVTKK